MTSTTTATRKDADAELIGLAAAAKKLGISPNSLYRMTGARTVPFRRLPGNSRILFAPEDIAEILATAAVRPIPSRAS